MVNCLSAGVVLVALTLLLSHAAASTTCGITSSDSMFYSYKNGSYLYVQGSGCPGYNWTSQSTPNTPCLTCLSMNVYYTPIMNSSPLYIGIYKYTNETTSNTAILGNLGISMNGVALFSNSDDNNDNAYLVEGSSFDTCKGHPSGQSQYHYHVQPGTGCAYTDTSGQHSPLLGIMVDGIPIYGTLGDNGVVPTDLDECNGHTDNTYSFYHYHVQSGYTYPYLVNCLRGCIYDTLNGVSYTCNPTSSNYNYTSNREALIAASFNTGVCSSSKTKTKTDSTITSTASGHVPNVLVACLVLLAAVFVF